MNFLTKINPISIKLSKLKFKKLVMNFETIQRYS